MDGVAILALGGLLIFSFDVGEQGHLREEFFNRRELLREDGVRGDLLQATAPAEFIALVAGAESA